MKEETFERDPDRQNWCDELAEQRPSSRRGRASRGLTPVGSRGGVSRDEVEKGSTRSWGHWTLSSEAMSPSLITSEVWLGLTVGRRP